MSVVRFRPKAPLCGSSSVVECHLAKVDVASPNLVYRSTVAPWPSGKAKLCKSFILQFDSGWRLQMKTQTIVVWVFSYGEWRRASTEKKSEGLIDLRFFCIPFSHQPGKNSVIPRFPCRRLPSLWRLQPAPARGGSASRRCGRCLPRGRRF